MGDAPEGRASMSSNTTVNSMRCVRIATCWASFLLSPAALTSSVFSYRRRDCSRTTAAMGSLSALTVANSGNVVAPVQRSSRLPATSRARSACSSSSGTLQIITASKSGMLASTWRLCCKPTAVMRSMRVVGAMWRERAAILRKGAKVCARGHAHDHARSLHNHMADQWPHHIATSSRWASARAHGMRACARVGARLLHSLAMMEAGRRAVANAVQDAAHVAVLREGRVAAHGRHAGPCQQARSRLESRRAWVCARTWWPRVRALAPLAHATH